MGKAWNELVKMQAAREAARPERDAANLEKCRPLDDAGLRDLMDLGRAAEREFNRRFGAKAELVENQIKHILSGGGGVFAPDDLTYAATARCPCGAGLAHPDESGIHGRWVCSAVLTGTANRAVAHDLDLPFAFFDVKSEGQPSAGGATTRPEAG